jgi:hypothetical protein
MAVTNGEQVAKIEEHLRAQDRELAEIKRLAIATNGRVTTLERERAVREALDDAAEGKRNAWHRLRDGFLVTAGASAVGSLVLIATGHHP